MKKNICSALAAVMAMSASVNVFAEYDKNYLDTTGRSIGQVADIQGYEYEEFKLLYSLPEDLPAYESENVAHNNLPVYLYAQMMGADFNSLKERYGWGDDITEQTTVGRALDSTTLDKYIGAENLESFKAEYGLGDDVTGDTTWGEIRAVVEQAEAEIVKQGRFSDVGYAHWAYDYISDMNKSGIIEGYDDGTYAPEKTITRAEFAKILLGAAEKAEIKIDEASAEYSDIAEEEWYYECVNKAGSYMFADEVAAEYRPDEIAKREDVAVALVKLKGYTLSEKELTDVFTDASDISETNRKYVSTAVENGLLDGFEDDTFRGGEGITRSQAAAVISRAIEKVTVDPMLAKTAIKAGETVITAGDIAYFASSMIYSGYSPQQAVNYVKDDIVKTLEYALAAREAGVSIKEDDELNMMMARAQAAARSGGLKNFKKQLKNAGSDISFVGKLLKEQHYSSVLEAVIGASVPGTISEDELKEKFIGSYYRAKHILVDDESQEGFLKGESLAENILDRAKQGEDFDSMTEKYTKDPGSESSPDGYIFTDGEMVPEFEECVKSLGNNKFGICKSVYGYHIIKRLPLDQKQANFDKWFTAAENDIAEKIYSDAKSAMLESLLEKYQTAVEIDEAVITELIESF